MKRFSWNALVAGVTCLFPIIYGLLLIAVILFDLKNVTFLIFCLSWGVFSLITGLLGIFGVFLRNLSLLKFCQYVQTLLNTLTLLISIFALLDVIFDFGVIKRRKLAAADWHIVIVSTGLILMALFSTLGLWASGRFCMEVEVDIFTSQELEKEAAFNGFYSTVQENYPKGPKAILIDQQPYSSKDRRPGSPEEGIPFLPSTGKRH
eukprot:Filipodium_phascolosomae@DN122_c0_g1_i1.p1